MKSTQRLQDERYAHVLQRAGVIDHEQLARMLELFEGIGYPDAEAILDQQWTEYKDRRKAAGFWEKLRLSWRWHGLGER